MFSFFHFPHKSEIYTNGVTTKFSGETKMINSAYVGQEVLHWEKTDLNLDEKILMSLTQGRKKVKREGESCLIKFMYEAITQKIY